MAGLASTRTYPLRSSFRPSYNMAVNLSARSARRRARELLEHSFAQFQADRSVVGLARQVQRNDEALAGLRAGDARATSATSPSTSSCGRRSRSGRRRLPGRARRSAGRRPPTRWSGSRSATSSGCRPGAGPGLAVVLDPGVCRSASPRPLVLTEDRWAGRLSAASSGPRWSAGPGAGTEALQPPFAAGAPRPGLRAAQRGPGRRPRRAARAAAADDPELARLRTSCVSTRATAARTGRSTPAGRSAPRLERDTQACEDKVGQRTGSLPAPSTGSAGCWTPWLSGRREVTARPAC